MRFFLIVVVSLSFSSSIFADASKTLDGVEGYVKKMAQVNPDDQSPYAVHYALGSSQEIANQSAAGGESVENSVFIQFCNRDEFNEAGFVTLPMDKVSEKLGLLEQAESEGMPVLVSYWDNGHPKSGKCIFSLEIK